MVNMAIIMGNLGKDPEVRYTQSGTPVCTFSVATSERFTKDGEKQEKTEWHNVVLWRGLAEIAGKYLSKGRTVHIVGKIQTRSYDDRDGNKRYITEIVADQMQMVGGRGDGTYDSNGTRQNNGPASQPSAPAGGGSQQQSSSTPPVEEPPFNPDDDIPF